MTGRTSVRAGRTVSGCVDTPRTDHLLALQEATLSRSYVSLGSRRTSSVHEFYRYPARFSPAFARAAIEAFSRPGSLVVDPFVGGGTTLVEARLTGRLAVGADVNSLAAFVSKTKVALHGDDSLGRVRRWTDRLPDQLSIHLPADVPVAWAEDGYFRNFDDAESWRIRKIITQALGRLKSLPLGATRDLARLSILRTSQWALDMRRDLPTVDEFREQLIRDLYSVSDVAEHFSAQVREVDRAVKTRRIRSTVLNVGVPGLAGNWMLRYHHQAPSLILTSPPYPGVYVLYHRWKVRGRKETPLPYWIANCQDGNGQAHYTMAARTRTTLEEYFNRLRSAFTDVAALCGPDTYVVQMVGFSDIDDQLRDYLEAMRSAGLEEVKFDELSNSPDGRLWRNVPSRRWWVVSQTRLNTAPHTAEEVVLVHRLRK